MTVLVVTLLVAASVAVLAYPLLIRRSADPDEQAEELSLGLRKARDRVYEEIRVLQQEYFLETVSQEEYTEQLQAARLRAAELLAEQQHVQHTLRSIDEAVEEQMRLAGSGGRAP